MYVNFLFIFDVLLDIKILNCTIPISKCIIDLIFLALCKFCEAILEYVANIEKAPDQTISKDSFANEIYSAYDILFNSWINTKTPKVSNVNKFIHF